MLFRSQMDWGFSPIIISVMIEGSEQAGLAQPTRGLSRDRVERDQGLCEGITGDQRWQRSSRTKAEYQNVRISPPLPFLSLTGGGPRDPLKMGVGSRMDQEQAALAAVTPSPTSASKRWPGASVWPSWDLLEAPKDPFSIEREARLHRQAAGKCGHAPAVGPEPSFSGQTSDLSGRGLDCMVESLHLHRMVCFEE